MEFDRLLKAILRKMWLIVALSIAGGATAAYISIYRATPIYEAETTVYAMNRSSDALNGGGINYQDMMVSRFLVQDYSTIIGSQKVISIAADKLKGLNISESALKNMIGINLKKDSSVMGIRAIANNAETAAAVANAMSQAFTNQIREMTNSDVVGILDEAKVPEVPIPGHGNKNVVIGALAGMVVAFLIIYVVEIFDTTIRSTEDVEHYLKLRVIGLIPEHNIQ